MENTLLDLKIGIIAGNGDLPVFASQNAKKKGYSVYSICFDKSNLPAMILNSSKSIHCGPGELNKIEKFLKGNSIKQVFFIGKVTKSIMFKNLKIDLRALKILSQQKRLNDDVFMLLAVEELEKNGIKVLEQTIFIKDFFAKSGLISGTPLTDLQNEDVKYGFEVAKTLGKLDIGQTVVVENRMILAIEAIEGTDLAIKRGCKLGGGNAVIVKVSKPSQDQRFDIPVVGCQTLKNIKKYGGKILAVEANETLIVNELKFKELASKLGITVIAV